MTDLFKPVSITAILLLSLSPVKAQANIKKESYKCVTIKKGIASPPPFLPGQLNIKKEQDVKKAPIKVRSIKPLCKKGTVPVTTRKFKPELQYLKGNPLIKAIKRDTFEKLRKKGIGKYIRNWKEVYQKKDPKKRPPPDPSGDSCDGINQFGWCYYYASASYRRNNNDGGGMTFSIERPSNDGRNGHSVTEISVQGGAGDGDIVELGWNVDGDQYGNTDVHLFVFHWKNWTPTCYDACGWVQYSPTYFPGMSLNSMVGQEVYIGYVIWQGNWWAWFNNQWLGYFPGSEWEGSFTKANLIQWFGEVAAQNSDVPPPRIDMGDGNFPANVNAAKMKTLCDVDAAAWVCWYRDQQTLNETQPSNYRIQRTGFGRVRYGGPGE